MDALHLAVALGPLALYLMMMGVINLSRRPMVSTGAKDAATLAMALSGFVLVGPMQLFLPEAAAVRFGPYIWLLLVSFYGLCVTLYVLLARPRLIVYNFSAEGMKGILAELVPKLDESAQWAGDSLALPQLGVQLHLEPYAPMRNVSLVATGERQSYSGWQKLEIALSDALRSAEVTPNPRGFTFLGCGLLMIGYPVWRMMMDLNSVAQQLQEMLRI